MYKPFEMSILKVGATVVDVYNATTRSAVMRQVRSKDTKPEMIVRRMLHKLGYRYRLHPGDLPGRPDIIFRGKRKAIFVHGCFWHQHQGCSASDRPSSNTTYWRAKLDRNVARDAANLSNLKDAGWNILVIWECKIKNAVELSETLCQFLLPSDA